MKLVYVVYESIGTQVGVYQPLCFKQNFTGDLKEICLRYAGDELIESYLYAVKAINIPQWMSEECFKKYCVNWAFTKALMGEFAYNLSREQFLRLIKLSTENVYFIGWIMNSKHKSDFLASMQFLIAKWLDESSVNSKLPLTEDQYNKATKFCPLYKINQISNKISHSQFIG